MTSQPIPPPNGLTQSRQPQKATWLYQHRKSNLLITLVTGFLESIHVQVLVVSIAESRCAGNNDHQKCLDQRQQLLGLDLTPQKFKIQW